MPKQRVNKVLARKRYDTTEDVKEALDEITNKDIRTSHLNFNYEGLEMEESEKIKLIEIEKELQFQEKNLKRVSLDIGKALFDAREIFIRTHNESFMEWYQALGLSKDQTSHFINRYKLTLEYPDKKDNILKLTDRAIKEVTNKKTPINLLEKVLNGEVLSAKEIKKERENISVRAEKFFEAEEAQIVESEEEKTKRIKKEIRLLRQEANELKVKIKELEAKADELERTL